MQQEKYGERDLTYSVWHRINSIRRYVGLENAQLLSLIDIDTVPFVEYDEGSKMPLALIETAMDVGQSFKTATVTQNLAIMAKLPCFVVLYTLADWPNPANTRWRDIKSFRVKRLNPKSEKDWRIMVPQEWADYLLFVRQWKAKKMDAEYDIETLLTEVAI